MYDIMGMREHCYVHFQLRLCLFLMLLCIEKVLFNLCVVFTLYHLVVQ